MCVMLPPHQPRTLSIPLPQKAASVTVRWALVWVVMFLYLALLHSASEVTYYLSMFPIMASVDGGPQCLYLSALETPYPSRHVASNLELMSSVFNISLVLVCLAINLPGILIVAPSKKKKKKKPHRDRWCPIFGHSCTLSPYFSHSQCLPPASHSKRPTV